MLTKDQISSEVRKDIENKKIKISGEDFDRPWGGFFKIDNGSLDDFLSIYFSGVEMPFDVKKLNVSPKILVVAPGKKLSWQSHERRSELWRVVRGPVGIFICTLPLGVLSLYGFPIALSMPAFSSKAIWSGLGFCGEPIFFHTSYELQCS